MKNVLVLSASPRKGGNSDLRCDAFAKGVKEAGPLKVEYTLTSLGKSLMKILDQLCVWGLEHRPRSAK